MLEGSPGVYEIHLTRPITTGAVTTIAYAGMVLVEYTSHPANVNGDSQAGPQDILALINHLNGVMFMPHGHYSVDLNHSGVAGPADILRVIDLLNGAGSFAQAWVQTNLPINTSCP